MRASRDLRNAVVVLTGASSGLGRAAALHFAESGARLVLAARDDQAIATITKECQERGADALGVPTDIRDAEQVDALRQATLDQFGRIDVWIEAAAVLAAGDLENQPVEDISELVATNVTGSALGCRAAMQTFRAQGEGTLIVVASLLGIVPSPLVPTYVMSKFAMRGLALSLRQAVVGEPNIDVCAVLPGPVDTPMFQRAANYTGRELRAIPPAVAPERVAAAIVACARRPRRQMTAGVLSRTILATHHLAPRAVEWIVAQYSALTLMRSDPARPTSGAVREPQPSAGRVDGGWRVGGLRRELGARYGALLGRRG